LPSVYWQTVFEMRVGRTILLDRFAQQLGRSIGGVWTRDWIAPVAEQRCGAPVNRSLETGDVLVNGRWIFDGPVEFPAAPLVGLVGNQIAYVVCDDALAARLTSQSMLSVSECENLRNQLPCCEAPGRLIQYAWEILRDLPAVLAADWTDSDAAIDSELDAAIDLRGSDKIHVGERAQIHRSTVLDATHGSVFISHDVSVGPHAVLEGPLYLGPGTKINPHSWLHGGNAIGPVCRIGGEVCGSVIQGYSNKAHAGGLGHSYVGSWVNIGAGATTSNLKNTYGSIRVPLGGSDVHTGQTFLGAIIADHAKVGINASLPSGAVFGFASSSATGGAVPKYVPSLSWVTNDGISAGRTDRLLDAATAMMTRRNIDMTDDEIELFLSLDFRVKEFESSSALA
jgi:UDP-N-acetylglucosamine diphosphorylase/glucosamine-1-phosphate N-acetyltransferase